MNAEQFRAPTVALPVTIRPVSEHLVILTTRRQTTQRTSAREQTCSADSTLLEKRRVRMARSLLQELDALALAFLHIFSFIIRDTT